MIDLASISHIFAIFISIKKRNIRYMKVQVSTYIIEYKLQVCNTEAIKECKLSGDEMLWMSLLPSIVLCYKEPRSYV